MTANVEIDPTFRQALQLLHSPSSDAAENIRKALDEIIKQRHGPNKMLSNTLSKKYLAEEPLATGSGVFKSTPTARRSSHKSSDSSSNNSNASPVQIVTAIGVTSGSATVLTTDLTGQQQEIPVIISLPDGTGSAIAIDDNATDDIILDNQHLKDLEDLHCVVCGRIDLSAKNRLIECTKCNALYHQECHTPQISDTELTNGQESTWCCVSCNSKAVKPRAVSSPAKSYSSSSSSSSNSSSSSVTLVATSTAPAAQTSISSSSKREREHSKSSSSSSSSRHHHHSSSSKHERTSSRSSTGDKNGSGNSKLVTPSINIISADKRLQNMKKKAAKTHESKRKK